MSQIVTYRYQMKNGDLYVSVSDENNARLWPKEEDTYGRASSCPYPWQEDLKKRRRRLEDLLRKDRRLLVEMIETIRRKGYYSI